MVYQPSGSSHCRSLGASHKYFGAYCLQVIISLTLIFATVPLVHFTSDKAKMGEFVNGRIVTVRDHPPSLRSSPSMQSACLAAGSVSAL